MHERTGKLEDLLEGTEEEKRLAKERLVAYIGLLIDWDEKAKEAERSKQGDASASRSSAASFSMRRRSFRIPVEVPVL